ncbi:hypothetical protein [Nigerium massiliense]|uniref:hypothetical protein n=1 Tax=Nigerium massiliense TaxID=1522317 RepID=UPI0006935980|nr:hypothetical protein [Nigerium massiliense]
MTSPISRRTLLAGAAAGTAVFIAGCSSTSQSSSAPQAPSTDQGPAKVDPNKHGVFVKAPAANVTATSAIGISQALLSGATAAVVLPAKASGQSTPSPSPSRSPRHSASPTPSPSGSATPGSSAQEETALAVAKALGLPLFYDSPELADELKRLQTRTIVSYGPSIDGIESVQGPASADQLPKLEGLPRTPDKTDQLVFATGDLDAAEQATLAAAGAEVTKLKSGNPGESKESVAKAKADTAPVLAVGSAFGTADKLNSRLETARTVPELPGGGVVPFPGRRMIALYGHPETPALGMMGEQSPEKAVERVKKYVDEYQKLWPNDDVIGAFEIIATVASGSPGKDGKYSYQTAIDKLTPWLDVAEKNDIYCVLDLQPGRSDFLTQAKQYEELLKRNWVGLALDPEWRLKPNQKHLAQIGQVGIDEINTVGTWLADLVRDNKLAPKVLTLHQFQARMIVGRERLDTSRDEIQYLVHVDGQGTQSMKQDTWGVLKQHLPANVVMGWKNFVDEDKPMLTPKQTVDQVHPAPYFISYQ